MNHIRVNGANNEFNHEITENQQVFSLGPNRKPLEGAEAPRRLATAPKPERSGGDLHGRVAQQCVPTWSEMTGKELQKYKTF